MPALRINDREKISGSRSIMRRLEQLVPESPLYPAATREAVEEAEQWGEEVYKKSPHGSPGRG